jgi:hypothetical protein
MAAVVMKLSRGHSQNSLRVGRITLSPRHNGEYSIVHGNLPSGGAKWGKLPEIAFFGFSCAMYYYIW